MSTNVLGGISAIIYIITMYKYGAIIAYTLETMGVNALVVVAGTLFGPAIVITFLVSAINLSMTGLLGSARIKQK
jgi:hypothetical protein